MSTNRHAGNSSQPTDEIDNDRFVTREISVPVEDDEMLGTAAVTVWMSESTTRGGKLTERIEGVFKLIFKGQWRKTGSTRHATCVGQLNGAPPVGVRVRPSNS